MQIIIIHRKTQSKAFPASAGKGRGFALIATLGVMALLMMVALAMLSLSTVELRNRTQEEAMMKARANARLALLLAIGELQKSAGVDQSVTAAADILSTDLTMAPQLGRVHWIGAWDTAGYDPSQPAQKDFLRWLVSSGNPGDMADVLAARNYAAGDVVNLFDAVDASDSVIVPKVSLGTSDGLTSSYAFWIEDEGVKADLAWNEGTYTENDRKQSARLTAASGIDYGVLGGPFGTNVSYPLEKDGGNLWLSKMAKALARGDMPLVVGSTTDYSAWVKALRHDVSYGSMGVMADVKTGGLRRDLSLAFEMDGNADVSASDQPAKFNQQVGEFVAGTDHLASQYDAPGMPVRERFLYRVTKGDGSPFSDDLRRDDSVVRGPNWWAMRDYYNLYKRLRGSSGNYAISPRSYFPNNSAPILVKDGWIPDNNYRYISQPNRPYTAGMWDDEVATGNRYVFHPARANYAPVLMGAVGLYSAKVENGLLSLSIDPLIYLWNPYNVKLSVDRYGVAMQRGHGGKITFKVTKRDNSGQVISEKVYGPAKTDVYIRRKLQSVGQGTSGHLTYLVSDLTMEPGEVVIVSPGSGIDATEYHDAANPGTNLTDSSGITVTEMPQTQYNSSTNTWELVRWESVAMQPGDEVKCLYDVVYSHRANSGLTNSAEHFWLAGFLPNDKTIKPKDLVHADHNAERVQTVGGNFAGRNWAGITELLVPNVSNISQYPDSDWPSFTVSNPASAGKFFFGINSHLLKPTQHTDVSGNPMGNNDGVVTQNAVEVFSQFNPFRTSSFVEGHRVCQFNETYSSISKPGSINGFIQEIGIQFPPTQARRGYWGENFHGGGGSTAIPFIDIPTTPILSLADFANANLSLRASEPYKKVGNSHASIFVPGNTLYAHPGESARPVTASDGCWLINDALFDRYYLSGFAPKYTISSSGYQASGTMEETLTNFYGDDYQLAESNPVLRPYLPGHKSSAEVVAELAADDGYKKTGAYSMIAGAFNVNSTSVKAWEALLRVNRDIAVKHSNGSSDSDDGTPFPFGSSPVEMDTGVQQHWAGFSRLTDAQITTLAGFIVEQVKARGPFMSLSDFVNRQLSSDSNLNAAGALQAALDQSDAMTSVKASAGGVQPIDPSANAWHGPNFAGDSDLSKRLTTEGIAGDIRQADLLRPLAARLSARSDTFRIVAYGEVKSQDGSRVLATATCEALVQRVPEYVDPTNDPWDEGGNSLNPPAVSLSSVNQRFGRHYRVLQFRWLASDEG